MEQLKMVCDKLGYSEFDNNKTLQDYSTKITGGLVKPSQAMLGLTAVVLIMMVLNIGRFRITLRSVLAFRSHRLHLPRLSQLQGPGVRKNNR